MWNDGRGKGRQTIGTHLGELPICVGPVRVPKLSSDRNPQYLPYSSRSCLGRYPHTTQPEETAIQLDPTPERALIRYRRRPRADRSRLYPMPGRVREETASARPSATPDGPTERLEKQPKETPDGPPGASGVKRCKESLLHYCVEYIIDRILTPI